MAFGHPSQHSHMMIGVQKALASPNTPAHLKVHLQKRLAGMPRSPKQTTAIVLAEKNSPQGYKAKKSDPFYGGY